MVYTRARTNHLKTIAAALMLAGSAAATQHFPKNTADQAAIEICEKIALARVQGEVLERKAQKYATGYNYEYLIRVKDGRKVVVDVDGKTRKVFSIMNVAEVAIQETGDEEPPE